MPCAIARCSRLWAATDSAVALGATGVADDRKLARGLNVFADSLSRGPPGFDAKAKRMAIPHLPFELKVGPYDDDEFVAALDRYKAAGYFSSKLEEADVNDLKLQTQRNPQHLFDRLAMM